MPKEYLIGFYEVGVDEPIREKIITTQTNLEDERLLDSVDLLLDNWVDA